MVIAFFILLVNKESRPWTFMDNNQEVLAILDEDEQYKEKHNIHITLKTKKMSNRGPTNKKRGLTRVLEKYYLLWSGIDCGCSTLYSIFSLHRNGGNRNTQRKSHICPMSLIILFHKTLGVIELKTPVIGIDLICKYRYNYHMIAATTESYLFDRKRNKFITYIYT